MSELPKGWNLTKIKNVTTKTSQKKPAEDDQLIYVDIGSIDRNSKKISTPQELIGKDAPSRCRKRINTNDILVSLTRPNLNAVAIVGEEYDNQYASTGFDVLKPNGVQPKFLYYLVRTQKFVNSISGRVQGALYPAAKASDVQAYEFAMPELEEQKRIANKLDSVLAKVEAAQTRLDKIPMILKRFRQSVLAAATSGELTKDWREKYCEFTNKMADVFITEYDGKKLGELPIEWGYVSFKDAAEIKSNLVDPKKTPDAIHLAPNHIEANSGRILELVTVEKDGVKSNKHRFFSGQIVYSKIRPYLNKVCAVDFEGLCSADMYPIESKLNREYLLYVMLSDQFVHFTSQQQGRVVLPKINQKALNNIPVPVPPEAEQVEIARVVSELLAKAEVIETQYKAAKLRVDKLTQSILAKAFRGELLGTTVQQVESELKQTMVQPVLR